MLLFLGGAISTYIASGKNGGIIWYGGMIFGAILLFRAFAAYRSSRKEGAPALGVLGKVVAVVGIVACLGTGITAVSALIGAETVADGVGSCWTVDDEDVAVPVSCDDEHQFKAISEAPAAEQCPEESASYLEGEDGENVLCIVED